MKNRNYSQQSCEDFLLRLFLCLQEVDNFHHIGRTSLILFKKLFKHENEYFIPFLTEKQLLQKLVTDAQNKSNQLFPHFFKYKIPRNCTKTGHGEVQIPLHKTPKRNWYGHKYRIFLSNLGISSPRGRLNEQLTCYLKATLRQW